MNEQVDTSVVAQFLNTLGVHIAPSTLNSIIILALVVGRIVVHLRNGGTIWTAFGPVFGGTNTTKDTSLATKTVTNAVAIGEITPAPVTPSKPVSDITKAVGVAVLAIVLAVAATGCTSAVPTSKLSGTIAGQTFTLSSPKNTTISNLVVEVATNGTAKISIGALSSVNDSNVISAADSGQAQIIKEQGLAQVNAMNAGPALAGKAAAAGAGVP